MAVAGVLAAMQIANLVLTQADGMAQNASDKELSLEQIGLQREENDINKGLLEKFLSDYYPKIAEQQRTELDKTYDDIFKGLMGAWGQQSASVAFTGQEAAAGTSAQAIMGETRKEIVYNFGEDLTKDMNGGLYALAKTNLENEIKSTTEQIEASIDILDRSNEYFDKAEEELNKSWWDKFDESVESVLYDINHGLGLYSGTREQYLEEN